MFVDNKEVTDEGDNVRLDIAFATKLKVVRNQLETEEATAPKEKFTLNADIRLKLLEDT